MKRSYRILETLLEKNVSIDIRNRQGHTALHLAAYGGQLDCVKTLVDVGADRNITVEIQK